MNSIAVDCMFMEDGSVRVRGLRRDDRWLPVEQGRQWHDDTGRHVLVMLDGKDVYEIILLPNTLTWVLKSLQGPGATVV